MCVSGSSTFRKTPSSGGAIREFRKTVGSIKIYGRAACVAATWLIATASAWPQTGHEAQQVTPIAPPSDTVPSETGQPLNLDTVTGEPPAPLLTPLSVTGPQVPDSAQPDLRPITPAPQPVLPADASDTETVPYSPPVPPAQAPDPAVSRQSSQPDTPVAQSNKTPAETSALFEAETFVLDPGHGGIDPGVTAADGTREKEITLALVKALGQILLSEGRRVLYTRSDDRAMTVPQRAALAKDQRNAVLLSFHVGRCAEDQAETGIILVRDSRIAENRADGQRAAAGGFMEKLAAGLKDRGYTVRTVSAPLRLQRAVDVPVILIECGCLENDVGRKMLTDESECNTLVRSLAEAITAPVTP